MKPEELFINLKDINVNQRYKDRLYKKIVNNRPINTFRLTQNWAYSIGINFILLLLLWISFPNISAYFTKPKDKIIYLSSSTIEEMDDGSYIIARSFFTNEEYAINPVYVDEYRYSIQLPPGGYAISSNTVSYPLWVSSFN